MFSSRLDRLGFFYELKKVNCYTDKVCIGDNSTKLAVGDHRQTADAVFLKK